MRQIMRSVRGSRRATLALLATASVLTSLALAVPASAYVLITSGTRFTGWIGPDIPVEWHLNTTLNDPSITNEFEILRGSWLRWQDHVANLDIEFAEGATTDFCGLSQNTVSHLSMQDCFNQCTGSCLAVTSTVLFQYGDGFRNTNTVGDSLFLARQESDITWAKGRNWEDYRDWPTCPSGSFDLWGVSVHEMGHFIGLGHSTIGASTMFASIAPCDSTKASLHSDDKRGARSIYRTGTRVAATTLNAGASLLTVTNKGNIGYTGPGGKIGDSFQFSATGAAEHLFEVSFALCEVGGPVSDNFREEASVDPGGDADLQQASALTIDIPGLVTAQEASAVFDDSRAESPYGVTVTSNFFADDDPVNEDFVICEYIIENTSGSSLTDLRAGLFSDIDYNNQFGQNSVAFDAGNDLVYVTTPNTTAHLGIAVLNPEGAVAMRALLATADSFTDANKEAWMSDGFTLTSAGPNDIGALLVTGDFDLTPGQEARAAFGIIGGTSLADLQANAQAAKDLYAIILGLDPSSVADGHPVLPIALQPTSPNPFSNATRLEYVLLEEGPVKLEVVDAAGRVVTTLVDKVEVKGNHSLIWDGRDARGTALPSGVYFTRLYAAGRSQTQKMHMIR